MQTIDRVEMSMAPGYYFTCEQKGKDVTLVLTQKATGRTKSFFQAAGNVERMSSHMRSLTTTQCDDWIKPIKTK